MKPPSAYASLEALQEANVHCRACPRLVEWREAVAETKVRRFADQPYWGRPVPGWGDPDAELAILGLAPAAHGANRTGRMFTGDSSGDWLYEALYLTGFANQARSEGPGDGLRLDGVYITAALHCVPPQNKPTAAELHTCRPWFAQELRLLPRLRAVLCLGRIAFDALGKSLGQKAGAFRHHGVFELASPPWTVVSAYHPSRQNTQTGRLTRSMWTEVFQSLAQRLGRR
jgi:uracil-DNA glycosylase family 4